MGERQCSRSTAATRVRHLLPALLFGVIWMPTSALAERFEATLDMDRDGTMDRAVLDTDPDAGVADLSIYLGAGEGALDPSRKPTLFKNDMGVGGAVSFEGNDKGS